MAEAWTVSRTANGINVIDENGLPVCTRVGLDDANLIASAPRLQEQVKLLREKIEGVLIASEDGGDMDDIDWSGLRAALEATKEI